MRNIVRNIVIDASCDFHPDYSDYSIFGAIAAVISDLHAPSEFVITKILSPIGREVPHEHMRNYIQRVSRQIGCKVQTRMRRDGVWVFKRASA